MSNDGSGLNLYSSAARAYGCGHHGISPTSPVGSSPSEGGKRKRRCGERRGGLSRTSLDKSDVLAQSYDCGDVDGKGGGAQARRPVMTELSACEEDRTRHM